MACLVAAWLLGMGCDGAAAETPESTATAGYRRVFVPADQPEAWPTDGAPLLPVEAGELSRLLQSAAKPASKLLVESIELSGEANPGEPVEGEGVLRLRLMGDSPGFLRLPAGPMAIADARWAGTQEVPAQWGWWPTPKPPYAENDNDPSRRGPSNLGVRVPESGELRFGFKLWPVAGRYRVPLPPASRRSLTLSLPPGATVSGEQLLIDPAEDSEADTDASAGPRVLLRPAAGAPLAFVLARPATDQRTSPSNLYSLSAVASLVDDGVESEWRVQLRGESRLPESVAIVTPPGLVVLDATVDGEPATVRRRNDATEAYRIPLVARAMPTEAVITLRAWTRFDSDQQAVLGAVQVENAAFQEGVLQLSSPEPWRLADLELSKGALVEPTTGSNDAYSLRLLESNALVTVRRQAIRPPTPCAIVHRVGAGRVVLRSESRLRPSDPDAPISLRLSDGWRLLEIDVPGGASPSWQVTADGRGGRVLEIDPLSTGRGASASDALNIVLRRQMPRGRVLPLPLAIPFWSAAESRDEHRLELTAIASHGLEIGRTLPGAPPFWAEGGVVQRLSLNLGDPETKRDLDASLLGVRWRQRRFRADCRVTVQPGEDGMQYQGEVTIRGGPAAESVVVRSSPPLPELAQWRDIVTGAPLPARLVRTDDAMPAPWQLWAVRTPVGVGETVLGVDVELAGAASGAVPLLSAPAAAEQSGVVTVRGVAPAMLSVEAIGLKATPTAGADAVAYRYSPASLDGSTNPNRFALALDDRDASGGLNPGVEIVGLTSQWRPPGRTLHTAIVRRRPGVTSWRFRLPASVDVAGVEDPLGQQLAIDRIDAGAESETGTRQYLLRFGDESADDDDSPLLFHYVETSAGGASVQPTLPEPWAAAGVWQWRVSVPQDWEFPRLAATGVSWQQRLLGPAARRPEADPFNPLRLSDWAALSRRVRQAGGALRADSTRNEAPADQSATDQSGWREATFDAVDAPPADLVLANGDSRRHTHYALGLMAAAVGSWCFAARPRAWLPAVAAAAVAALVSPVALLPAAQCLLWGLVAAGPLAWLLARQPQPNKRSDASTTETLRGAAAAAPTLLAVILALGLAGLAAASPPVEPVLIPVDETGAPVDELRYLHADYLKRLLLADANRRRGAPADAVVLAVALDGVLQRASADSPVRPGTWQMTLETLAVENGAQLTLPIERPPAGEPASVTVDGLPAPVRWRPNGDAEIALQGVGPRRVVVSFRPRVVVADAESAVQIAVPPGVPPTLRVMAPPELLDLRCPFALGVDREESGVLNGVLDGSGEALVCWTEQPSPSPDTLPQVDALVRVAIQPQGVTAAVRLLGDASGARLELRTPRGWQSLDRPKLRAVAVTPTASPGDAQQGDQVARFRIDRLSPLGMLHLPAITTVDGTVRKTLVSVDCAPALRLSALPGEAVAIDELEFLERWPKADETSAAARSAAALAPGVTWSLAVGPAAVSNTTSQQLKVLVGTSITQTQTIVSAGLLPGRRLAFAAPPNLLITGARSMATPERDLRWTRPTPDRVVVWLPASTSAATGVALTGTMPTPEGPFAAPLLQLSAPSSSEADLLIARTEDALVEIESSAAASNPPARVDADGDTRSVASIRFLANADPPVLTVTENEPRYRSDETSRYSPKETGLTLRWTTELTVVEGVLGSAPVAIDLPRSATVKLVEPETASLSPRARLGPGRVVRFAAPLRPGQSQQVVLEASVPSAAAGALAAPWARLPGATSGEQVVVAPTAESDAERFQVTGLGLTTKGQGAESGRFTARRRGAIGRLQRLPQNQVTAKPTPLLAEHRLVAQLPGERVVVSRLSLLPRDAERCRLALKPGWKLRTLRIDGADAVVSRPPGDDGVCEFELRSPVHPQRLEVTSVGPADGPLTAPRLVDSDGGVVSPLAEVWSAQERDGLTIAPPANAEEILEPGLAELRLGVLAKVIEAQGDSPAAWRGVWTPLVRDALTVAPPDADPAARETLSDWLEAAVLESPRSGTPRSDRADNELAVEPDSWRHFMVSSGEALSVSSSRPAETGVRFVLAFAIATVLIAGRQRIFSAVPSTRLPTYGPGLAALAGVAWWLLAEPSVLGLLVLAASAAGQVAGFFKAAWRRQDLLG
ncbi:MAG: hypothetical protein AAGJ46_00790 [Planctomycetota bacterium]